MPNPITMTRAQYQSTYGAPPQVPTPAVQPATTDSTPVTMTKAQYQQTYGQQPNTNPIQWVGNQISQAFKGGISQFKQGLNEGANAQNPVQLVESSLKGGAGLVGAAFSSFAPVFAPVNASVNALADKISNNQAVQQFAQTQTGQNVARGAEDIANTAAIAQGVAGIKGAPEIKGVLEKGANAMVDITKPTEMSPTDIQTHLQGVADEWAKPTTMNEPKYNNAKAVLSKDPQVTTTLAQKGIDPFTNIEDGKYSTEDTAQKIRDDNGTLSKQLLRPSLEKADAVVTPTTIEELKPSIDNTYGVTPDDAEAIQAKLTSKMAALQRKYPNGMTLANMLDEKITYDANGGYKPFKSNADNIDAIANRSIANTIRNTLETKGEAAGIPVKEFQAELSKNYRAADYLDALNGKKAPVSMLQSAVRYTSKIAGARIAGMVGGGDIVSEFMGYHIGGALEKFVENMTNPMRNSFLQNLKTTNPTAFAKMEEYLKTTQGQGFTMKDSKP